MGEEVLPSYLRSKLSSILDEAEADSGSPSQIISRFRSIESQIKSNYPVMILYELVESVSECRVFAYERRTAAVSKKGYGFYFIINPVSELMFNRRMRKRLDSIERRLGTCPPPSLAPPPGPVIEQTRPIEDPSLIIGFEAQADKIEAWIMPAGDDAAALAFRAVGIVGRCGCGKTALAQKVFASPRIVEEFSPRIWVCLSNMLPGGDERVDPRVRVANYILGEIGHDLDNDMTSDSSDYMSLAEKLQRGLMGKRYLIVLDGARRLDDWYDGFLPRGSGGAVIMTSRRENVIRRMVGDDDKLVNVMRLEPHLSDEICWQIFSQVLQQQGKLEITHPKLSSIRDDVKRSFDGLPLVARTSANTLTDLLLKSYWIPARDLSITWGGDTRYWRWISLPPPQQTEEVAELVDVCWLDIKGYVDLKKLLIKARYSAFLVFKLKEGRRCLNKATARVRIVCDGKDPEGEEECRVFIDPDENIPGQQGRLPQAREGEEGWMEIKLGDFFTTLGDDGRSVEVSLFEVQDPRWKSGLVVKGIELR
ncbi:hypothetical protein C2S51_031715 [Perilla frutescens var. frutescens]|nr:hypothetical protein C2S51_031715 [Perilla frutescens var. frutescens]